LIQSDLSIGNFTYFLRVWNDFLPEGLLSTPTGAVMGFGKNGSPHIFMLPFCSDVDFPSRRKGLGGENPVQDSDQPARR
jgi:hypothetical protein